MKNSLFFFAVYKKLFTFAPAKHKNGAQKGQV